MEAMQTVLLQVGRQRSLGGDEARFGKTAVWIGAPTVEEMQPEARDVLIRRLGARGPCGAAS